MVIRMTCKLKNKFSRNSSLINYSSLKSSENLDVVKQLPLERILLETDAPWCEVRPSHAGYSLIKSKPPVSVKKEKWVETAMVKSRNEPCLLQ
jgi:TatD DNase family protein